MRALCAIYYCEITRIRKKKKEEEENEKQKQTNNPTKDAGGGGIGKQIKRKILKNF